MRLVKIFYAASGDKVNRTVSSESFDSPTPNADIKFIDWYSGCVAITWLIPNKDER